MSGLISSDIMGLEVDKKVFELTIDLQKKVEEIEEMCRQFRHDSVEVGVEGGVSIFCELIKTTVIGQVAPGVATAIMAYRQLRFEKRTLLALNELQLRVQSLGEWFSKLNFDQQKNVREGVFPLLFDYVADEPEEEKIKLFVNGFGSAVEQQVTEQERILFLYDILKSLRMIEIKFLLGVPEKSMKPNQGQPKEWPPEYDQYRQWLEGFPVDPIRKRAIIKHLNGLSLIVVLQFVSDTEEVDYRIDHFYLSQFGKEFIDFFKAQGD